MTMYNCDLYHEILDIFGLDLTSDYDFYFRSTNERFSPKDFIVSQDTIDGWEPKSIKELLSCDDSYTILHKNDDGITYTRDTFIKDIFRGHMFHNDIMSLVVEIMQFRLDSKRRDRSVFKTNELLDVSSCFIKTSDSIMNTMALTKMSLGRNSNLRSFLNDYEYIGISLTDIIESAIFKSIGIRQDNAYIAEYNGRHLVLYDYGNIYEFRYKELLEDGYNTNDKLNIESANVVEIESYDL